MKFFSNKVNFGYIVTIVFLIIFFSFSYVTAINKVRDFFIDQQYRKEELATISGANSIHIFLETAGNSLLLLSRNPSVINQGTDIQTILNNFATDWSKSPIIGAARFDKNGDINFFTNNIGASLDGEVSNISMVDRSYLTWAKTAEEGSTYLGKPELPPIKSANWSFIIPLLTPIYKDGEFNGVLALAISLPRLTATYLDPLQVSPGSRAYLVHSDSTVVGTVSGYEGLVGTNYLQYLKDNPYPGSEKAIQSFSKALIDNDTGEMDLILYSPTRDDYERFLIAYTPVMYEDQHWTIGLAAPISDVEREIAPFREGGVVFISLIIIVLITFSVIGSLLDNVTQEIEHQDVSEISTKKKA